MYKSLHIKNFRGFKDFEIGPLARINLIGGKNNVGKTALLEAIFLLNGPANPGLRYTLAGARGFESLVGDSISALWENMFNEFRIENEIELSADTDDATLRLKIQIATESVPGQIELPFDNSTSSGTVTTIDRENAVVRYLFTRGGVGPVFEATARLKDGEIEVAVENQPPKSPSAVFAFTRGHQTSGATADRFSKAVTHRLKDEVLQALQVIEPKLQSLELVTEGNQKIIYGDLGGDRLMPLPLMGGGLIQLLTILVNITHVSPNGIALFDEIENGFHYSVLEKVWRAIGDFAEKQNVQLFATTHSDEIIDAAKVAFEDKDDDFFRWHRLDRLEDGTIEAVTYDKEAFDASVDLNYEVR